MKRQMSWIVGWAMAAGLALAGMNAAQAAPFAAGAARTTDVAVDAGRSLIGEVGYYRRHYRRAYYGRPVYRYRPVRYRQVYYSRPVYYRPVQYRPAYYGGYGYNCYIKKRTVYTLQGIRIKRYRICN